ncbi:hypothetical protein Q3253_14520 [Clostridioides difficile]|nr:MAG TPA: hypothetical protein [Caudoviricetes sp.]
MLKVVKASFTTLLLLLIKKSYLEMPKFAKYLPKQKTPEKPINTG